MNPLAELYSYIDGKKRQLRGLLSDPVETINQGLLNFRDDQNNFLNLAENAYPGVFPGSKTVLNTPEQVARLRKQFGDKATDMAFAATFIGPNAKTWDALSAKKAQELAAQGVDPRKIWSETGTWKGPDGKWRQEIPDNKATVQPNGVLERAVDKKAIAEGAPQSMPQWVYMNHDNLYQSYPDAKKITISPTTDISGGAYYDDPAKTIGLSVFSQNPKSSNIHELQHAIQQREGWAKGGSPETFEVAKKEADANYRLFHNTYKNNEAEYLARTKGIGQQNPSFSSLSTDTIKRNMDLAYKELKSAQRQLNENYDPQAMYRLLAGEAEARATQARIPLDAAQRRALFPEDSYDVPIDQLIIRGLLN